MSNNAKEEHATMPTKELRMTEYFPLVRFRLAQVLGRFDPPESTSSRLFKKNCKERFPLRPGSV